MLFSSSQATEPAHLSATNHAAGSIGGIMLYSPVILVLLALDFFATWTFSEVAKEKGYPGEVASIWLLGIFGTFFAAGLYAAALPDKLARPVAYPQADPLSSHGLQPGGDNDELPNP